MAKFTHSKSHFSQNSHFQNLIYQKIHIFQTSNSREFMDKMLVFAPCVQVPSIRLERCPLGMGLFPEMICSREREFPGIAEKIPGNSREFKIHYIGYSKFYIFTVKRVLFASFGYFWSNYGQIQSKILFFFKIKKLKNVIRLLAKKIQVFLNHRTAWKLI